MNILIFGGDLRQISAAKLFKSKGYKVTVFAIARSVLEKYGVGDLYTDSFVPADINVFPLPVCKDGINVNCPLAERGYGFTETFRLFTPENKIYVGMASTFQKKFFEELKLNITDYYGFEELQIKNAVPTAEGAIELFLTSMPITIMESEVTVIGYGRIGRVLATRLKNLGADVTVCARSEKDLATARVDGMKSRCLSSFLKTPHRSDCIFNTVPFPLFNGDTANKTDTSLFIDLASAPYGCDENALKCFGEKYIKAASLPGKTAPVTAGIIIAGTILRHLESEVKTS